MGIRRSTFLPTGTKWEGETRNELWSKEPRFLSRKIVVTLLCGGNLPFDGYRGLCLDGRGRRRSHDSTVEIAHYFFLLHLGENIYIYIYGDSKGENRIPDLRKRSRLILPRCKRGFFLGGGMTIFLIITQARIT